MEDSLSVENTLWSNTVVASGSALGVVIYTGAETRSVMNTSQPPSKVSVRCPVSIMLTKTEVYLLHIRNIWHASEQIFS